MVVSQSLLEHGTLALENYALAVNVPPWNRAYYISAGPIYQLELVNGHIMYHLPPGSSMLSVPYVGLMKAFGISPTNPDGTYNVFGEVKIEFTLAGILMASLATLFYYTARLKLPRYWSIVVSLGGTLGTQVTSTASRALWSDTWGIVLLGIVLWMLLAQEVGRRRLNPILLASLVSWLYFIRPTYAVHILAITVYVFIYYRKIFIKYVLTGAVWFIAFIAFSLHYHGRLLPSYYQANRLNFGTFWTALAGNLVSPARGLLVYVPVLFFVAYLLARYWKDVKPQRLVVLTIVVTVLHLIAISGFAHWWGGHSFGARFCTGLVPWFVLLAVLGLKAMLTRREREVSSPSRIGQWQLIAGSALLLLSVFINCRGALSNRTWLWNSQPVGIDRHPERLWDWREPQFLAGLVPQPLPKAYPIPAERIDFSTPEAEKFIWYGWGGIDQPATWTDGKRATMIFTLDPVTDLTMQIKLAPFLVPGSHDEQRVFISVNGQQIEALMLRENEPKVYQISLPKTVLRNSNVLEFSLPDAIKPASSGVIVESRQLGIAVYWMQFQPGASPGVGSLPRYTNDPAINKRRMADTALISLPAYSGKVWVRSSVTRWLPLGTWTLTSPPGFDGSTFKPQGSSVASAIQPGK